MADQKNLIKQIQIGDTLYELQGTNHTHVVNDITDLEEITSEEIKDLFTEENQ